MNQQMAYFYHPHCPYPNDPKRATLWWAMLQEYWMTADDMIELAGYIESNAPLACDRIPKYNKSTPLARLLGKKMNDAIEDVMEKIADHVNYFLAKWPCWELFAVVWIPATFA